MRVLILGGTGSLGRVITRQLLNGGHDILLLGRNPCRDLKLDISEWIVCDRRDHGRIKEVFNSISVDAIIDLSGFRSVDVRATLDASKTGVAYFFMSSVAVAPVQNGSPTNLPIREIEYESEINASPYAFEKAAAERYVLSSLGSGSKRIVIRAAEIVGACDAREQYFFLRNHKKQNVVLIPDGGHNVVHPVDVRDVASAIEVLLNADTPNGIYHVAGPSAFKLCQFVSHFFDVCQPLPEFVGVPEAYISLFKTNFYYPFFPRSTVVSAEKLHALTGFSPKWTIEASIQQSWTHFLSKNKGISDPFERQNPFVECKEKRMLTPYEELTILEQWQQLLTNLGG